MPPTVPAASSRSASEIFIRSQDRAAQRAPTALARVIPIASPAGEVRGTHNYFEIK
jgi:hypothetical protein